MTAKSNFGEGIEGQQILAPEQCLDEFVRKIKECEERGHIGPIEEPFPYSPSNWGKQEVMRMCQHCLGSWYRGLNEKEQRQLRDFYDSLREPFTI